MMDLEKFRVATAAREGTAVPTLSAQPHTSLPVPASAHEPIVDDFGDDRPDPAGAAQWCYEQHVLHHGPPPIPHKGHNDWLTAFVKFCNESGAPESDTLALALNTAPAGHNEAKIDATVRGIYRRNAAHHGSKPYTAPRAGRHTIRNSDLIRAIPDEPKVPSLADLPFIPPSVYEALPAFLRKCLAPFAGRERDVLLTSLLAALSGCFPNVTGIYRQDTVGLNLYTLVLAPAANGKGVLKWAGRLLNEWDRKLRRESAAVRAAYDAELAEYDARKRVNRKTPEAIGAPPTEPPTKRALIPANSSAAACLKALADNGGSGAIIETEGATLAKILGNKEWGDFTPLLLAAFHHERFSCLRKTTGEIVIERPALSVALTGTPGLLAQLMPDTENGLFSRFLPYAFAAQPEWINPFASAEPLEPYFDALAVRLLTMIEAVSGPVRVFLTAFQKEKHTVTFDAWTADTPAMDGQAHSSLRRLGLSTFRLAMLLTILRCFETGESPAGVLTCADEDFTTALTLAGVFREHTNALLAAMPKPVGLAGRFTRKADKVDQKTLVRELHAQGASYRQIVDQTGIGLGTISRWLKE